MYNRRIVAVVGVLVLGLCIGGGGGSAGAQEGEIRQEVTIMQVTDDQGNLLPPDQFVPVEGSSVQLVRTESGATIVVTTSGLTPGNVYIGLWVIFNNPEACEDNQPQLESLCFFGDIPNSAVEVTIQYGSGRVVMSETGEFRISSHLPTGFIHGIPVERNRLGPGLQNPMTAEIHFALRNMGPVQPDIALEQLSMHDAGCMTEDNPEGFTCFEQQVAFIPSP